MIRFFTSFSFICAVLIGASGLSMALQPDEMLDDPVLEERARDLSADLRCLVCQNQSIDDSNADLAKDLRLLVRERLVAGDSNDEVIDFIVARYGQYVLLDPPWNSTTILLWTSPFAVFVLALFIGFSIYRRNHKMARDVDLANKETQGAAALNAEEAKRLSEILGHDSDQKKGSSS